MDVALSASTQAIQMLQEEQAMAATLTSQRQGEAAPSARIVELPAPTAPGGGAAAASPSEGATEREALRVRKEVLRKEMEAVEERLFLLT